MIISDLHPWRKVVIRKINQHYLTLTPITEDWPWWHCRTRPWPWSTYRDPHRQTTRSWSDWAQSLGYSCTCPGSFSSPALGYCPCHTPSGNLRTWCLPASGNQSTGTKIEQEKVIKNIFAKCLQRNFFSFLVSVSTYFIVYFISEYLIETSHLLSWLQASNPPLFGH